MHASPMLGDVPAGARLGQRIRALVWPNLVWIVAHRTACRHFERPTHRRSWGRNLTRPPMRQSCNVTLVVLGRSAPSSVKIETLDQILRELLKPVLRSNL